VPVPVPGVAVPDGDEEVLLVTRDVVVVASVDVEDAPGVEVRVDDDEELEVLLEVVVEAAPGTHWK